MIKRLLSVIGGILSSLTAVFGGGFSDSFTSSGLSPASWEISTGYSNGSVFANCMWWASQVSVNPTNPGYLTLNLGPEAGTPPYAAAEVKTVAFWSYGMYTVRMKPSNQAGVISSFFTYTGPYYGDQWNEIDIEFGHFGSSSQTGVQFNYFVNGTGGHEVVYLLPFDPSTDFHTYGFDREPDFIAWYVDGVMVYQTPAGAAMPASAQRLFMNIWAPYGIDGWVGNYDGTPTSAVYDWVSFVPSSNQ